MSGGLDRKPYEEAYKMKPLQWMFKHCGKQMLFSFLFILIFIIFPWIGPWYIETTWLRWLITCISIVLNFVATFLHPYLTWRDAKAVYIRSENILNK